MVCSVKQGTTGATKLAGFLFPCQPRVEPGPEPELELKTLMGVHAGAMHQELCFEL